MKRFGCCLRWFVGFDSVYTLHNGKPLTRGIVSGITINTKGLQMSEESRTGAQIIDAIIDRLGLSMTYTPTTREPSDPSDKDSVRWNKEASHWAIKVSRKDSRYSIETVYSMGAAHRRWRSGGGVKLEARGRYSEQQLQQLGFVPGKRVEWQTGKQTAWLKEARRVLSEPTPPDLRDVLWSLCLDSMAYENAASFEDYAIEYGYSTDSRKAERIYRECGETCKKLKAMIGLEVMQEVAAAEY